MNLKSIIAGTLAGAVATTPVTANAQEYAGKSAGSAYTMASETPIRDSIEGYASEPNIRLMKTLCKPTRASGNDAGWTRSLWEFNNNKPLSEKK